MCESVNELKQTYFIALESGDLQHAALSSFRHSQNLMYTGCELTELKTEIKLNRQAIEATELLNSLPWNDNICQFVLNLMGESEDPCLLIGEFYDENHAIEKYRTEGDRTGSHFLDQGKFVLYYLFECYDKAAEFSNLALEYIDSVIASSAVPVFYFYDSLVQMALCGQHSYSNDRHLKRVSANQLKMKVWAESAPTNYAHKFHLVEAECHRIASQYFEVFNLYDCAIAGAKKMDSFKKKLSPTN